MKRWTPRQRNSKPTTKTSTVPSHQNSDGRSSYAPIQQRKPHFSIPHGSNASHREWGYMQRFICRSDEHFKTRQASPIPLWNHNVLFLKNITDLGWNDLKAAVNISWATFQFTCTPNSSPSTTWVFSRSQVLTLNAFTILKRLLHNIMLRLLPSNGHLVICPCSPSPAFSTWSAA